MAGESKLQKWIHKELRKSGWVVTKIMLCSTPGWPDTEAIKKGRTVRIEIKDKGKKANDLQLYVHKKIKKNGGEVYVVDSKEEFTKLNLI